MTLHNKIDLILSKYSLLVNQIGLLSRSYAIPIRLRVLHDEKPTVGLVFVVFGAIVRRSQAEVDLEEVG